MPNRPDPALEALYREAVDLADRARGWFDGPGIAWRAALPIDAQAHAATESLAITARLMAAMSWLLDPSHAIGHPPRPFAATPDRHPDTPTPLADTPGDDLARASRQLVEKIAALAAPAEPGQRH